MLWCKKEQKRQRELREWVGWIETCVYISFTCCLFLSCSLGHRQKPKYNVQYMNSREKPTTLLCTVDQCWEFKGISGFLSLYSLAVYSRSIYYSTESIRWHSIAESLMEINIKKIFFIHILTYIHMKWLYSYSFIVSPISLLLTGISFFLGREMIHIHYWNELWLTFWCLSFLINLTSFAVLKDIP